jgi:phosphatidylglycerol:prolipoprotein diacylglycerol transferase
MKMISNHYVHDIDPFAVRFHGFGPMEGIRWYGIFYVLSFAFTIFALNFYSKRNRSPLSREQNWAFMTYAIGAVIIGGRLGYMLLYCCDQFLSNPLEIFALWHGGMSSHGGFIGVIVAIALFCRAHAIGILPLADICATIAPFGFFLGRVANFINGELCGRITDVRWGVIFPRVANFLDPLPTVPRHPSQLYEGFLEGIVLFLYMQIRFWTCKNRPPGRLSGEFLILYAVFRIFTECFREPDADLIFNMSRGQFYSIFLAALGVILLLISTKNASGKISGS